jgi:methionine-S-sulfoxide reductase
VSVAPLRVLALLGALVLASGAVAQDAPREDSGARAVATFAGGCFWCMEPPYDKLDGVISTTAGYAGGPERDPAYRDVAGGKTGHAEVVQVVYDPARVDYETLLRVFWRNIDPFAVDRQFCDAGPQYRTAIFYHDAAQRAAAEASLAEVAARFGQEHRDPGRAGGRHLPRRRGVSPGLLPHQPRPLPLLPLQLRPRPQARADLGRRSRRLSRSPARPP